MDKKDIVVNGLKAFPQKVYKGGSRYIHFECKTKREVLTLVKALYKLGLKTYDGKDNVSQEYFEESWSFIKRKINYYYVSIDWNYLIRRDCEGYVIRFYWAEDKKDMCSIPFREAIDVLSKIRKELRNG